MADDREVARAERARERRERGMLFERVAPFSETPPLHGSETPEQRWAAMATLCRAAWLATGRPLPTTPRAELPGEIFWIDDAGVRRAL